ncbi:Disease resistance-like protein [Arachis hypogaea]|nr:Disease resistance-like protein [Arachis hypogaea]
MHILKHPIVPTSLVGIEEIRKIVKVNMKQHRVIGIWGMRGIGKTTIAKMLFAKSFPHYDHVCYAENAKEYTPQRLLSELLRERITTDATGFVNSMSSLSNKKVLIILDNVKDSDQPLLEAVCEGYKSHIREKLLSLKAFEESIRPKPYEILVNKVVNFYAKLLVEIRMPHSHVKKLWEEKQELNNLEGIDLSKCKELEELPDLSEAKRLRWVSLSGCETLPILHSFVFSSNTLVSLILDKCTNLQCHISVKSCSNLRICGIVRDLIENLDLSNTKVEKLDKSIGKLHKVECLILEGSRVKHLPKELSALKLLKELKHLYSGLEIDKHQLQGLFNGLSSLQILHLKDCSHLFEFPDNIDFLSKLRELRLDGSNVTWLPATIKCLQELEILSLNNCKFLETLPELPSSIKEFSADNCISLESVSALNTLATKMVGKTKCISFNNSLKLSAGHTLHSIMESIHSTMVSAVSSNVTVRSYAIDVHSYNYNSVEVCLPGDTIPKQFAYKTEKSSSITIELPESPSNFLGFIYSVVLSPRHGMEKNGAKIRCEYNFAGGKNSSWEDITISELNSDHVYIWYDPFLTDKILGQYGPIDDSIIIKECGVHIINELELQRFLLELDKKKKDMEEESSVQHLHFHPPHGSQHHSHVRTPPQDKKKERFDEKQSNDIQNQISKRKREMNEQSSFDRKIEEKMESAPNENKASGGKSDEENIDISNENYYDLPDSMEEAKHLEEKLQEVHHNVHDMTADEPYKENQGEPMDLETSECQDHTSNVEQQKSLASVDAIAISAIF